MTSKLEIEVRDSLEDISVDQWNALTQDGNPFLRHEFLHSLDVSGCLGDATGWYPRYFLLWQISEDARDLIAAVPTYVKTNSYGEFVFDWAWAEAFERHQLEYYPKLVSSIPFTPATGQRLLIRQDQPFESTLQLLASSIRQFSDAQEYSGVHYLFVTEAESKILSANEPRKVPPSDAEDAKADASDDDYDLQAAATDHLKRIDCQYHWKNANYSDFDDFLSRCTSKRRKTIRRERRYVSDAGLRLEQRLGSTLSAQEWQWVRGLYESTYDRKWGNPSLTLEFFERVGQLMGDNILIVLAYDNDDSSPEIPVACSIMFIGESTLYGRYWGCRKEYNSLHFEACYYQGIDYCIEHSIATFEPGAQGEHKITRGFVPTLTRSAHYISHPGFRDAIANYLSQERPHIELKCTGLSDLLPFKSDEIAL